LVARRQPLAQRVCGQRATAGGRDRLEQLVEGRPRRCVERPSACLVREVLEFFGERAEVRVARATRFGG
jgi:hypothetical protein